MDLHPGTILDAATLADPTDFYAHLRQSHPVWKVPGLPVAYVASYGHVVEAIRRVEDFSNHLDALIVRDDDEPALWETGDMDAGTTTLATADPPEHTRHRNLVFPELVAQRMATIKPQVEILVDEQMTLARGKGRSVEWTSTVANPVPARVIAHVIGLPASDWPQVMGWAMNGTALLSGAHDGAGMEALAAEAAESGLYLATALIEAAAEPADDLLGVCARAVTNGELTLEEAVGTLVILLGAGGESTASLIGNAVRMLADDPGLQKRIRADRDLLQPFLEEVLRLESPFRGHFRQVKRDCELGGVALEPGTTVLLLWASANRDPAEYERPDEVVLDRQIVKNHLAFGRGIHHCVGAGLARMEASVAVSGLLDETTDFSLDPADPPTWEHSLFVRRHERLPLLVDWRST